MESDMMITDYSTLSSDYSILNKPQLFVITDVEEIKLKKDLRGSCKINAWSNYYRI